MSTLASSRPPPLKLTIPSLEEAEDHGGRSGQEVGEMHPDCLPLPLAQPGNSPQVRDEEEELMQAECEEQLNIEDEEDEAEEEGLHDLDLEDPASCCSETSVLSVGQEQSQAAQAALSAQAQARQRLLISQIYRPSAFSSSSITSTVLPPSEGPPLTPEELLQQLPPSTGSTFQEEFLRKSQLYAEELMKQQMHLMAAARVNALTAAAAGKQLQMAMAAAAAATVPSGQDALAQLTATALGLGPGGAGVHPHQQLLLQRDQVHHHHHMQNHLNNNENLHERALKFSIDNILKADFGSRMPKIGGLSGHVGGGITGGGITGSGKTSAAANGTRNPLKVPKKSGKPLNLAQSNAAANSSLSFSSSLANICSNSNDSNSTATSSSTTNTSVAPVDLVKSPPPAGGAGTTGVASKSGEDSGTPIVWPAWVYCTRYSDRPSSGRSKYEEDENWDSVNWKFRIDMTVFNSSKELKGMGQEFLVGA
ncbi:homeobox protein invected-like [Drosophila takahashii]|uniref:homeobox protein invected-like n=1 Tax=Drosophila takahashii TaxID=29030 RepID=UPI00389960E8